MFSAQCKRGLKGKQTANMYQKHLYCMNIKLSNAVDSSQMLTGNSNGCKKQNMRMIKALVEQLVEPS